MSRSLKTWGTSESALAEMIAHRLDALDATGNPTIAFLARGIEGSSCASPPRRDSEDEARALVDAEEKELRAILGDLVFGVDDETMESRGARRACAAAAGRSASPSRSPAGFIGARIANVPGASDVFRGTIGVVRDRREARRARRHRASRS